jgi:hypothetical protein
MPAKVEAEDFEKGFLYFVPAPSEMSGSAVFPVYEKPFFGKL